VSYEIGGDIFSLSEIEHCVIGGKLAPPYLVPRNFCPPPPPQDDHYSYALSLTDKRIHFLLNCCSVSSSSSIFLLRPDTLYLSLNDASLSLFSHTLLLEMKKRTVTLPKCCEMYRNDFGESSYEVLRHILRYLGREQWEKVTLLLNGPKQPTIKFHEMECRSHDSLQLIT
jgi:hypothetical protein